MEAEDRNCVWSLSRSEPGRWAISIRTIAGAHSTGQVVGWARSEPEARMLTESMRMAETLDPAKSDRSFLPVTDRIGRTRSSLLPHLMEASDDDGRGIDLISRIDAATSPLFRISMPNRVVDEAHVQALTRHHAMLLAGNLKAAGGMKKPLTRWG